MGSSRGARSHADGKLEDEALRPIPAGSDVCRARRSSVGSNSSGGLAYGVAESLSDGEGVGDIPGRHWRTARVPLGARSWHVRRQTSLV